MGALARQPSSLPQMDSYGDTAFLSGWASFYGSPQHNGSNPADLPYSGGRAGAYLASCLAGWLEWVLGPLLIPSVTACLGRAGWWGGERRGEQPCLLSRQEAGVALSCTAPHLSRARHETSNGLLAGTLLDLCPSPSSVLGQSWVLQAGS